MKVLRLPDSYVRPSSRTSTQNLSESQLRALTVNAKISVSPPGYLLRPILYTIVGVYKRIYIESPDLTLYPSFLNAPSKMLNVNSWRGFTQPSRGLRTGFR